MSIRHMHKADPPTFLDEAAINEVLSDMEDDEMLRTNAVLIKDEQDADKVVSFREKHASYLKEHPKVNPGHYLANLHAMIKIRP